MVQEDEIPSVKDLASSDPTLRRRALATITTHLTSRTAPLTPTQALQLQKGFFYALYMHDSKSPLSVQQLTATLAELTVSTPRPVVALPLSEAFWSTMAREWTGIDAHRMDKYLLLVRLVVREVFAGILAGGEERDSDSSGVAGRQIAFLEAGPLNPRERKVPDGLRYHVLDVYVDELERALGEERQGLEESGGGGDTVEEVEISDEQRKVVERVLGPVETVARDGLSKGVRVRAKETLADERVVRWRRRTKEGVDPAGGAADGNDGNAEEDEWEGLD